MGSDSLPNGSSNRGGPLRYVPWVEDSMFSLRPFEINGSDPGGEETGVEGGPEVTTGDVLRGTELVGTSEVPDMMKCCALLAARAAIAEGLESGRFKA